MDAILLIVLTIVLVGLGPAVRQRVVTRRSVQRAALERVRMSASEEVTAHGEDLMRLEETVQTACRALDEAVIAAYQGALDSYEEVKFAAECIATPDDSQGFQDAIEDGRHAIACVRAMAVGDSPPTRHPTCFFDPRHGPAVADVPYVPLHGVERYVPACSRDTERILGRVEPRPRGARTASSLMTARDCHSARTPRALSYFDREVLAWLVPGSQLMDNYWNGLECSQR